MYKNYKNKIYANSPLKLINLLAFMNAILLKQNYIHLIRIRNPP